MKKQEWLVMKLGDKLLQGQIKTMAQLEAVRATAAALAALSPFEQQRRFMEAGGQTTLGVTNIPQMIRYIEHVREEVAELTEAANNGDVVGVMDALVDTMVVCIGAMWSHGMDPQRFWDAVHASNMAKIKPDGTVDRRPDGGIAKPEGWQKPDLWSIVQSYDKNVIADEHDGVTFPNGQRNPAK